ncbi:hypothetical protein NSK_001430 [Nannochloropsis salina CCMP1776]|uniref:Uncharacterized protein n=1 Tax=Nannochloropsis salina CCMP1776 TaxID=1027361 RepID=A0A4D9D6U5_9STRA|nr:hypothetical protein NSK_001430 [Nannochloropsis salina CCMP1776]|eukprot:TFJ87096.1 hypothetical protein NSK_001430 [Nannochloropsis salina CCMP1776]
MLFQVINSRNAVLLRKELEALATAHAPQGSEPLDSMRYVLGTALSAYATEKVRHVMLRDAKIPGSIFEMDHTSPQGSKLVGEGARLSRILQVTDLGDVRLLNGLSVIDATVLLGETLRLHFAFRREPMRQGTSLPRMRSSISINEEEREVTPDMQGGPRRRRRRAKDDNGRPENRGQRTIPASTTISWPDPEPTTIVNYEISASNGPAEPFHVLLRATICGFHPTGLPSPAGVHAPPEEMDGLGTNSNKDLEPADVCVAEMDEDALEAAIAECGTSFSLGEFVSFLLLLPYHEEEWDVCNLVMDQLFDQDDESSESGSVLSSIALSPYEKRKSEDARGRSGKKVKT